MKKEELEKLFPIDSLVELIDGDGILPLKVGMIAKITGYRGCGNTYDFLMVNWVDSPHAGTSSGGWYPTRFKLVDNNQQSSATAIAISKCPRCNGVLKDMDGQDPFSGKVYKFQKCQDCGWC